jgi:hypothetical protein
MKTSTLFQLGGIAVLLYAVLIGISNLMYFLSGGQPITTLGRWVNIADSYLLIFGLVALFGRLVQAQGEREKGSGTVLLVGLIGFVLLMLGNIGFIGVEAVGLGVTAGAITEAQIAQVPSYAVVEPVLFWIYVAGEIIFGISIYLTYRAREFPRYAGVVLALAGLIQPLTGELTFVTQPAFAILSFVAYAWLGWTLLSEKSIVPQYLERSEPVTVA